jgi:hypothetical protein
MSLKNKDLLKTISDRFIKPKVEEEPAKNTTTELIDDKVFKSKVVTPTASNVALDVVKIGRDYYVVEIEYNLDTMQATVLSSTVLDNKVVALSFGHGKSGIDSIITRNKRFNKGT